ncbi:hypothetical protein Syun_015109 [Stephania yunnanensis]|uniref:Uncharacterized protein n=1 Tax=Stephania yunnanensis TaxID=152371 RepID=A0AAP0JKX7_9MAGN
MPVRECSSPTLCIQPRSAFDDENRGFTQDEEEANKGMLPEGIHSYFAYIDQSIGWSSFLNLHWSTENLHWFSSLTTDINPHAVRVTCETLDAHGVHAEVICADIATGLDRRLEGLVELLQTLLLRVHRSTITTTAPIKCINMFDVSPNFLSHKLLSILHHNQLLLLFYLIQIGRSQLQIAFLKPTFYLDLHSLLIVPMTVSLTSMIELSRTQDEEVGDGTTSVIILAGEMLHVAEAFINKSYHPTVICRAYTKALEDAVAVLDQIAMSIDVNDHVGVLIGKGGFYGNVFESRLLSRFTKEDADICTTEHALEVIAKITRKWYSTNLKTRCAHINGYHFARRAYVEGLVVDDEDRGFTEDEERANKGMLLEGMFP